MLYERRHDSLSTIETMQADLCWSGAIAALAANQIANEVAVAVALVLMQM